MLVLTIIRGLPGAGKTRVAEAMSGPETPYVEADMFRYEMVDGDFVYVFRPEDTKKCHEKCQSSVRAWLESGNSVIVSNTFVRRWEMEPYFQMAKEFGAVVQIIEVQGPFENEHGVPEEVVARMRAQWEDVRM